MTNREKMKQVLEDTFGIEFEGRIINQFKGCDYVKNTECNNYMDCEHCKLYHFWYNEFKGESTPVEIDKEQLLKSFKVKLRDIITVESNKTNAEGEYIYSFSEEKLFVKLIEIIWSIKLEDLEDKDI